MKYFIFHGTLDGCTSTVLFDAQTERHQASSVHLDAIAYCSNTFISINASICHGLKCRLRCRKVTFCLDFRNPFGCRVALHHFDDANAEVARDFKSLFTYVSCCRRHRRHPSVIVAVVVVLSSSSSLSVVVFAVCRRRCRLLYVSR